ncbi:hypothetical protein [Streptomyces sp. NBC_01455]|nr:hypothetical protein [Streptomyces sp. NBC_01455]
MRDILNRGPPREPEAVFLVAALAALVARPIPCLGAAAPRTPASA